MKIKQAGGIKNQYFSVLTTNELLAGIIFDSHTDRMVELRAVPGKYQEGGKKGVRSVEWERRDGVPMAAKLHAWASPSTSIYIRNMTAEQGTAAASAKQNTSIDRGK